MLGAGPLKAEDCLLGIANHKQRAQLIPVLPGPGKELTGQRVDDPPLCLVCILRLIDRM